MELSPYLHFDGRCAEAFRFYADALGGTLTMTTFGETPMAGHVPADWHDKIVNAEIKADGATLRGTDAPPAHYRPTQGFGVTLLVKTAAQAERLYNALSAGGSITMPLQKTFWSESFGMFTDRYGMPWMVEVDQAA